MDAQERTATAGSSSGSTGTVDPVRSGSCASTTRVAVRACSGSGPASCQASVERVAVQLPGRAERFHEPAHDRMRPLIDALVDVVKPLLDRPFACYGVSMGARVAWAFTRAMRERAMPLPRVLFVACDPAPANDSGNWPWEGREDDLEGYLREMGGTPPEVLAEPDLLAALLPTLRADLAVLSKHRLRPATPLDVPIHRFAGQDDPEADPARMAGWRTETSARFDLDVLESQHFFDPDAEGRVVRTIGRVLG